MLVFGYTRFPDGIPDSRLSLICTTRYRSDNQKMIIWYPIPDRVRVGWVIPDTRLATPKISIDSITIRWNLYYNLNYFDTASIDAEILSRTSNSFSLFNYSIDEVRMKLKILIYIPNR